MADKWATIDDIKQLVSYLKSNCYKKGEFSITANSDLNMDNEIIHGVLSDGSIKQIIKADRRYYARSTVYDGILDNVHIEGNSEIYEYMQNCNIQGKKVPLNVYQ